MKHFSTREAARILEATEAQVRSYARLGQIGPAREQGGDHQFTFQELLLLRTTRGLIEAGVPARRVRRVWSSLRRQLSHGLPLTSITIFADGERAVAWDGAARWRPDSGQFLLNFDADDVARRAGEEFARALAPRPPLASRAPREPGAKTRDSDDAAVAVAEGASSLTAEQWFLLGYELEVDSLVEAREAYRRSLERDPMFADAHINLGWLAHQDGELGKAEAHYRDAVRAAPEDATAHFNLGVLLEDRGRPDDALHAYEQALARDPDCADAHYNLGLLLEARHRRPEAMKHLMAARHLYGSASGGL